MTTHTSVEDRSRPRSYARAMATALERRQALEAVCRQASTCAKCPQLAANRTQVVFGTGDADADLMFVGEAPGPTRTSSASRSSGSPGSCSTAARGDRPGTRGRRHAVNVLKCRPPGNRDPLPVEIDNCQDYLFEQIELVQPKVICTLGNFSTKLLRRDPTGITRLHGRAGGPHDRAARRTAVPAPPPGRRALQALEPRAAARGLLPAPGAAGARRARAAGAAGGRAGRARAGRRRSWRWSRSSSPLPRTRPGPTNSVSSELAIRTEASWDAARRADRDRGLRAHAVAFAAEHGASEEQLDSVAFAVSEVVTNAAIHGYAGREPGPVTVRCRADGVGLVVEVTDEGAGVSARDDSPGVGFGLATVGAIVDASTSRRALEAPGPS